MLVATVSVSLLSCQGSRLVESEEVFQWEEIQSPVNTFFRGVAWSESLDLFVAVGNFTILTSHNGRSWTRVDSLATERISLRKVIWDGERFIVTTHVGSATTDDSTLTIVDTSVVLYSSDGINWNRADANKRFSITDLAFSGKLYVGIGAKNSSSATAKSLDTWTVNNLYLPPHHKLSAITWTDSIFIAGGELGIIRATTDGINWVTRYSGEPYKTPLSAEWSGSRTVMVGMNGLVIYSDDGLIWKTPETKLTGHLHFVKWTGERFVAVGESGVVAVSTRGNRWTELSTPTVESLRAIALSDEVAVIVGGNGTILVSRVK